MRESNPTDVLNTYVATFPRQVDAAKALDISPAYLNDLMHGRRDITDSLLVKLGLKRIVVKR